ncbi:MAG: lamin tail domain-containing protein [Candidatus Liptonbacteria bacterium]|nr:lamin tail domain-containing protein [Candidatus Liptonbacteria bacterium]
MVLINEWFPNPPGKDAEGEWVELWNSSPHEIELSGYTLSNGRGQTFALHGYRIKGEGYLVLDRATTKLTLRNQDEELSLYANGVLVDASRMRGSAEEGKSISRQGEAFFGALPTPGAANRERETHTLLSSVNPPALYAANLSASQFFLSAIVLGALISLACVFTLKTHHGLSELFFGRDEKIR